MEALPTETIGPGRRAHNWLMSGWHGFIPFLIWRQEIRNTIGDQDKSTLSSLEICYEYILFANVMLNKKQSMHVHIV